MGQARLYDGTGDRVSNLTDYYYNSASDWTFGCWVYIGTITEGSGVNESIFEGMDSDASSQVMWLYYNATGKWQLRHSHSTTNANFTSTASVVGAKWYCVVGKFDSTTKTVTLWVGDEQTPMAAPAGTSTTGVGTTNIDIDYFGLGSHPNSSTRVLNGGIGASAFFTRRELSLDEAEAFRLGGLEHIDAAGVKADWALSFSPNGVQDFINNIAWTVTGTTEGAGPKVKYELGDAEDVWFIDSPTALDPITGSGSVTLENITATGTGSPVVAGSGDVTLEHISVYGAGSPVISGLGSKTLEDITATGSGSPVVDGSGASTLDDITATGAGSPVITGSGSVTLENITATGAGAFDSTIFGNGNVTRENITATGAGSPVITGSGAVTLENITATGAGSPVVGGSGAAVLDDITADGAGSPILSGSGAAILDDITATGAGAPVLTGSGAASLEDITADGVGAPIITGSGNVTLEDITVTSTGEAEEAATPRIGFFGSDLGRFGGRGGTFGDLASLEALIEAPVTKVLRWVDIYEADGVTPWLMQAPLVEGSISVDYESETRRTASFTFENIDGSLSSYPAGFWYDKIIKAYRGAQYKEEFVVGVQVGEFMPDKFSERNFPHDVKLSCRDLSKKLILSKFGVTTSFAAGQTPEALVRTIALNGGITRMNLLRSGKTIETITTFEGKDTRWSAILKIAEAYGFEVFFDANGYLVMRQPIDPSTAPSSYTIRPGLNLVSFDKSNSDTRIFNSVIVSGQTTLQLPVWAYAKNENPDSPTRIARLGERTYEMTSALVATTEQAQEVADKFLRVAALEVYELQFESLVYPWFEVGEIVTIETPRQNPGDPTRFLLTSVEIPMNLQPMSGVGRRITIVA